MSPADIFIRRPVLSTVLGLLILLLGSPGHLQPVDPPVPEGRGNGDHHHHRLSRRQRPT